jgi:Calcineurin-like phosphoesterase
MPPKPLKIVILTDILIGADKLYEGQCLTVSSQAKSLLKYIVKRTNDEIRPDFVVQLGNLFEDEDEENDADNYETAIDTLKQLTMPIYHLIGDREQAHLDLKQIRSILTYPKLYYSFDSGAFHFVALFATSKAQSGIHVEEAQCKWLQDDLAATEKPTVVFIHFPIDDPDLTDTSLSDDDPALLFVEERAGIREILVRSGKVRAVFNGHNQRNNLEFHDPICYVSLQSFVKNMSETRKVASESFAIVTLTEKQIKVEIEGMDRAEYLI